MTKTITLKSSDGETFAVEKKVAMELQTVRHLIEVKEAVAMAMKTTKKLMMIGEAAQTVDEDETMPIMLPKVNGHVLAKIIEYCTKHRGENARESGLKSYDEEFVKVDEDTLFKYMTAADYLGMKSLLDLATESVATSFKNMSPQEIRRTLML